MTNKTKVITLTVLAASITSGVIIVQDLSDDESAPIETTLDQLSEEAQLALMLTEEEPVLNTQRVLVTLTEEGEEDGVMRYGLIEQLEVDGVSAHSPTSPLREKDVW